MSRPEWIHPESWNILEAAKAAALAEGAKEILVHHLFQGFARATPDLLQAVLKELGADSSAVKSSLKLAPPSIATADPLDVSTPVFEIIRQAKTLAGEYPFDVSQSVAPVHLWVSLCGAAEQIRDLLKGLGLSKDQIQRLVEVSRRRLPEKRAGSSLQPDEIQILSQFCHRNLTQLAREGRLAPACGVDDIREELIRVLLKKNKRSVVLTGPAGVGKTKLVEDLALRLANGELPELAGCEMFELDLALFTQGTHLAGSRAERWTRLTSVLRSRPDSVILFIDELHSIIGLPLEGQAMDLANMLKPLLVDDKVRIVGATTSDEFRRHIEKDAALVRRFTEVKVPEPDRPSVLKILRHVAPAYEEHYGLRFSAAALDTIYDVAHTYIPNQSFPAKAVDLVDEVGISVKRERGGKERAVVQPADVKKTLKRIWGVEPESLSLDLVALLKERVVGQDHAVQRLSDAVITSARRYGKDENHGPRSVILFLGPPGVGKSHLAQAFAEILFPGQDCLLTLDMTEFSGRHTGEHARFRLLGPPPPYVGWETGGLLTSHALQHPISVVLIDEFEKSDPTARNVLLKIFNDGWAQDGRGRVVSFSGTYFILTANAGHRLWQRVRKKIGFGLDSPPPQATGPSEEQIREVLLREGVTPELLSRISEVVLFKALGVNELKEIARRRFNRLRESALLEDLVVLEYDEKDLAEWVVKRTGLHQDCRRLTAVLKSEIETPLAYWRLGRKNRKFDVVRLATNSERIEIREETGKKEEAVEQVLFARVAALYKQKEERRRNEQSLRLLLGTSS